MSSITDDRACPKQATPTFGSYHDAFLTQWLSFNIWRTRRHAGTCQAAQGKAMGAATGSKAPAAAAGAAGAIEAREAAAAAQSLLFLQQYGKRNAVAANPSPLDARNSFPDDLPPSDELPTSEEEDEPSAKSGHGTSGRWAVLTPSTFSDGDGDGAVFYLFLPILSLSLRYGQIVNVLWSSPMATKFDACDRILVRHVPGPSTQEIHKKQSPGLATRG
ncbi:hypothetical protein B0H10DRAFT_1957266 [Mycena sp. CBHHK59/15]|nr:hypothetical protein B0H10DRAFT_1966862 [Mycena sp. CBHHK59/15]KAJ6605150.1 hypothetical protein B0H10DRAFT_1957266 [Mycena sp. CBHHK59/15]